MATHSGFIRRGLPRVEGGEPWPPAGEAPARVVRAGAGTESAAVQKMTAGTTADTAAAVSAPAPAAPAVPATAPRQLRRGLPRVPGGEPWPTTGEGSPPAATSAAPDVQAPAAESRPVTAALATPGLAAAASEVAPATPAALPAGTIPLRRGLPRVPGGEPWPPAGRAPATASAAAPVPAPVPAAATAQAAPKPAAAAAPAAPAPAAIVAETAAAAKPAAESPAEPKPQARLYGSRTLGQWSKRVVLLAIGAVAAAAILVLAARGVTTLPGVPAFLERYPGEYALPAGAEPGFPWWAQWTHFLNIFLITLIIRSGYQVRTQQKPPAFWTPKHGGKKISITLWLHQSLDVLWLANGLIFAVLLFSSGRWMRIVPTSWEVFPNALSALLQYMTLDWPVENGWVNYNSLQQLMYFLVVFVAAPLAAITGVRMSEFWPKNAKTLNRIYPVEVARALHFPTMLFFVLFILVHVFLVFATGALRNLNHMFGGTDMVNWVGFWLFAAAIAVTTAGWYAARPLVLAPLARLTGQVSSR